MWPPGAPEAVPIWTGPPPAQALRFNVQCLLAQSLAPLGRKRFYHRERTWGGLQTPASQNPVRDLLDPQAALPPRADPCWISVFPIYYPEPQAALPPRAVPGKSLWQAPGTASGSTAASDRSIRARVLCHRRRGHRMQNNSRGFRQIRLSEARSVWTNCTASTHYRGAGLG